MNRNWDIMRNAANGADPWGETRRMDQNRMRDRERFTGTDRMEGSGGARWFDGVPDYGQGAYGRYRNERPHRDDPRYGGYGYEQGEREALADDGAYGYGYHQGYHHGHGRDRHDEHQDRGGILGRIEQGIDRAFGRDWERDDRPPMASMRGYAHGDEHPSLWDRVKGAFSGKGPKNWTRSDERIHEDVCEALTYHPYIDASEIEVTVKDGEVTLAGVVEDRRMKRLAEDVVDDVRGVRDVHNQIRIQRISSQGVAGQSSTVQAGTSTGAPAHQMAQPRR